MKSHGVSGRWWWVGLLVAGALRATEPPLSWIDPDTGHRVIRLTREPGSASLYFNDNGYTPDGRAMVYTTPEGISVLDLQTGQTRPLVHGRVRVVVVGRKTPTVFYVDPADRQLHAADIGTGRSRAIAPLPPGGAIGTINADETLAAGTYPEGAASGFEPRDFAGRPEAQNHPLEQPANKGQMMERRLAARIPLAIFTLDLRTGAVRAILHGTDWYGHLQFSPTDPAVLMYCHEGPWHKVDRIWTIRSDGTQATLIHRRSMQMEIAGHEFWSRDGSTIWYDLQVPKGEVFYLAGYNRVSGERTWYHLERDEWSIHFNVADDGTLFCGDGGDPGQVARAPHGAWIYLFRPRLLHDDGTRGTGLVRPGVLQAERLVNMSRHNYRLEPNVSFTPDQKFVIFRSNLFGPTYVFGVEVARARPPP